MRLVQADIPTDRLAPREALKLPAYVAAVLLAAAVLAPWLHDAAQHLLSWMGGQGWLAAEIQKADMPRYFTRSAQVMAVLLLLPLIRWAGMDRRGFPVWRPWGSGVAAYGLGFVLAMGLLMALGAALVQADIYRIRPDAPWTSCLTAAVTAALGAGVLEEWFFRGALLGWLLRCLGPRKALFWCTFLFAFVHFLKPPEGWQPASPQVTWTSGFEVLGAILSHFGDVNFMLAEFATLFAVGWAVGMARLTTGRLWLSAGLHGGWIFGLKYFSAITRGSTDLKAGEWLPWIGLNLKIGLIPLVVVSATGWIALLLWRRLFTVRA
ncbi:MAG: CPBP family intramembrane metalloprotease [Verrucomicrobiales bacterium]|nr:CPBP family intramembrane metalloprotease [Verrucomicrobiales bacterium]